MTATRDGLIGEVRVSARPRPARLAAWIAFAVLLVLAFVGYLVFKQRQAQAVDAAQWSLSGAPCQVSNAQALRGGRPPMTATYDGVKFERRSGFIQCVHRRYDLGRGRKDYAVCQFSSPQAVGVTVGRTQTIFVQPISRSLRIAIIDGKPICVLIAKLRTR